jgi:hypothetical protein
MIIHADDFMLDISLAADSQGSPGCQNTLCVVVKARLWLAYREVPLKFPNIRLFIANRLLEDRLDCVDVMVRTAYDVGLVPAGSLDDLLSLDDGTLCGSMLAARAIIEKHFESKPLEGNGDGHARLVEKVWTELRRDVEAYKARTCLNHVRLPGGHERAVECGRMAPVVFDLLLQHLQRY